MNNTATTTTRLFGIKRILDGMTPGQSLDARKLLPNAVGLGSSRVNKIIYATEDTATTITTNQAKLFAEFFGVSIEEIITPYEDGEGDNA